ncbi:MAG: hypothetical protein ACK6A7_00455 [Planctomycetota bacterium]
MLRLPVIGHDYIDIGTQSARYNDADIWMLRHILLHATPNPCDEASAELYRYLGNWQWAGPGIIIGSDFNNYLKCKEHKVALHRLLEQGAQWLDEWGESIPKKYLDQFDHTGVVYLGDQPTSKYRKIVLDCLRMLREDG